MDYEKQQSSKAKFDYLMFDLDDTLYPLSSGIAKHCSANIQEYMVKKLGIDQSNVAEICYLLYKYYGTTMAGLKAVGYDFDYDDYHSFVHGRLPYELLKADPVLKNILLSLPIRKVVFTNSDKMHALRALTRLGLKDCFERIICFETLNPIDKGNSQNGDATLANKAKVPEIFDIMKYAAESNSNLFSDDSIRNLLTAKRLGLHTVLVGNSHRVEGADYALESIHNIKEAFPELLEADDKAENVRYSRKVSVETPVPA